ncbi:MAG: hypothetical protein WDW38_007837 [Sanguina aurantia]
MADATQLLDFSLPTNVALLDATVSLMYGSGTPDQRQAAEKLLLQFQEHPQAWVRVDSILESSQNPSTKYFALQILESVIRYKWGALPADQREGIKLYLSNLIIRHAGQEETFRKESTFINKLNISLVQILKQEWPHRWPSFIPDLVSASKTSETLCENSMRILRLLSEEVFDFARLDLTQAKTKELKAQLNNEFRLIHELCLFVLANTRKADLVRATLDTLSVYLTWVPLGYIFECNLLEHLLQLFPQAPFRNLALQCLTEVGSLVMGPEFNTQFETFYVVFMRQLAAVVPPTVVIPDAYEKGTDEQQKFVQNLALFFTGFFKAHIALLETDPKSQLALLQGLEYLVNISYVENVEVFKTCLDYWNFFVPDVYSSSCGSGGPDPTALSFSFAPVPAGRAAGGRRKTLYAPVLARLRQLMICRMAKPEEVIVVEDENGNIVRETMKDNDVLAQYKSMRETLIYLCHLDHDDTESQMLDKLRVQQQAGQKWTWQALNTLCWAIGSISGSMTEEQENRFLVSVIRDLLNLCEMTRGKDNKAVIASNIMCVGAWLGGWVVPASVPPPPFLQLQEREPFICELLTALGPTIQDLQPHQIHLFYESVGLMIGAESDAQKRDEYLTRLMAPPNATWNQILAEARGNPDVLKQPQVIKNIQNVLQTNVSIATSLGQPYVAQFNLIFTDMLQVYKLYSELISRTIAEGQQHAARTTFVKYLRSVKKVALKLIETFTEKCEDTTMVATQAVPAMIDPVLADYARSIPDARDAEVLSLFAAIIAKLKGQAEPEVPRIFEATFECTLIMISRNFEDFPEHRLQFFALLHSIVNHCFGCLFLMTPAQLKLVIDSIVWAFRHTERNVAETGLSLLLDLLGQFAASDFATAFHQTYFLHLMQEVLSVLTDSFHKPGFKLHARILHHLFTLVDSPTLKAALWDVAAKGPAAYPSNAAFVREHVVQLLTTNFPNMTALQDNADLFAEEVEKEVRAQRETERLRMAAIPGMIPQSAVPLQQEDMADM